MRAVLILNPTSGISTVTEKQMSVEGTEKAILQGLQAWGMEPVVYYTTPEETGKGLATRAAAEQIFLEVAGVGLEAELFPAAEEMKKPGLLTTLHGVVSGLKTLLTFKPTRIRIAFDDRQRRPYEALQVTICNAPFYGMHLEVVPNILMDDGLLDVAMYRNFSKLEYIRHALSISQGRRRYEPKIVHRRVQSLRITSDQPLDLQVDGVAQGTTPAEVTVLHGALRGRVPDRAAPGLHTHES